MPNHVVLLSIPGLREKDVEAMSHLREVLAGGEIAELRPSFPCVTCPVQANMTTGRLPREHGVVSNGFYWRDRRRVEMWTAGNECVERPQLWEVLRERAGKTSAVWFPLHSKRAAADLICTPAPIHNPDGSESLWCYTKPEGMYGELRDALGHFPLQHFWGPMAGIPSSDWIVDSAVWAARQSRPDLFYIYLPHLDYAAQKSGPDSERALKAVVDLDEAIARLAAGLGEAYGDDLVWLIAGEYAIAPVDHVTYPNRVLREAGLLAVREEEDGEHLDPSGSEAWAMVDHQLAHVFVRDGDQQIARRVADLFREHEGIAEVLLRGDLQRYALDHARSGELVLVSEPNSWQAYYWWLDDLRAPAFARTVDIHRKPGYDPVELCFDPTTRSIPLDATLIRGSHGAPAATEAQRTVLLASQPGLFPPAALGDTDVFRVVLRGFGIDES